MDAMASTGDGPKIGSTPRAAGSQSGPLVPFFGAVVGFLIALGPVLLDRFRAGLQTDGDGYGPLLVYGLVVGPIIGALFAHEVRADRFRIGLAIRMALLAVVVGDILFVVTALAESSSSDGAIGGALLVFILGLVVVGPFMALVTAACAIVWQGLMMIGIRVAVSRR